MKNFWNKIKPFLIITFWLLCCGSVIVLLSASIMKSNRDAFQKIEVTVDESNGNLFVDQDDILQLLKDHQLNPEKAKAVGTINYASLEKTIESNPFVQSAQVYLDANDNIQISVKQRVPILRIINSQRVSYYLDDHGRRMPVSAKFTARVPVATGNIFTNAEHANGNDSLLEQKLFVLTDFIRRDSFLNALFDQIVVNQQQEFELIPIVGNHSVLIGDVDDLDQKFSKLKTFYKEGLNHTGWNQYSEINLKYENEVYCTRKGTASGDSTANNRN